MAEKMQWDPANPFHYDFERGLYYHPVMDGYLLCGSQPCSVEDIEYLAKAEGVKAILSLQEEKDPLEWGIDVGSLHNAMKQKGIDFHRAAVMDFDPHSLRAMLPHAAHILATQLAQKRKVYVHCTAGLGRAPAACIAYLYWFQQMELDGAYAHVTQIRPCGPKRESVRGATFDMLAQEPWERFAQLPEDAWASLSPEQYSEIQHRLASKEQIAKQPTMKS